MKKYAAKTYWGHGDIAPAFLNSALDGDEWLGWVGPRTGLDDVERGSNSYPSVI
jgi:hypothetical protein